MNPDEVKDFIENVAELREKEVLALVKARLLAKDDPLTIIEDCQQGMLEVGERYNKGQYFISSLIVAGEIFRGVVELIQPAIRDNMDGQESGSILIGTVHGDIHDLGKNLFGLMMRCHGFKVSDIGVDVPPEEFYRKALELKPDIIGLSGLLTIAFDSMRDTVDVLKQRQEGTLPQTPVIIGSSLLKPDTFKYVGADYWTTSALNGVNICKQIITGRQSEESS